MESFQTKIGEARANYLDVSTQGETGKSGVADEPESYAAGDGDDEQLERVVYGRFLSREAREEFYTAYRDIEAMWEILSPSPGLRDHIPTFGRLVRLYRVLRNAYSDHPNFIAGLARKTRQFGGGISDHQRSRESDPVRDV